MMKEKGKIVNILEVEEDDKERNRGAALLSIYNEFKDEIKAIRTDIQLMTKPPNGWSYIAKQTEYSVKTSFHSRWIISSVPGLTCNIAFLIISHWRRLSENCAGYIMNKRLSEKYM